MIHGYTNKLKQMKAAPKFVGKTSPRPARVFKKQENVS